RCRNHQPRQKKCDSCRKEAIAAESVEKKRLHIEKPESREEHRKHSHGQKSTGTAISKGGKSCQCKHGKVSNRTDGCDGNAGNFRVSAAEHSETVRRTTADRRFASKILHKQVGGVRQACERDQADNSVNNDSGSRQRDCCRL